MYKAEGLSKMRSRIRREDLVRQGGYGHTLLSYIDDQESEGKDEIGASLKR
jgi:hypothetical protein